MMTHTKSLLVAAALVALGASPALAQGAQYRGEAGPFVLQDCRVETVTRGTLTGQSIVLVDGKIAEMGSNVSAPSGATIVPCNGATVYPGLIDSGTQMGISEVGSLEETQDVDEIGDIAPQMRALTAVNPSSPHIAVTRLSGVTTTLVNPGGGLFPGTAALIHLHGYTPEQMAAGFEGVRMLFPSSGRRGSRDRRTDEVIEKADKEAMDKMNDLWKQAQLYARIDSARAASGSAGTQSYQPEMEALLPVIRRERLLLVEANAAKDIVAAIEWLKDKNVRAVLTGAAEGWRVADKIVEANLPVITGPVLSRPTRASDRYDRAYDNAALMARAGLLVALRTNEAENVRNLPFNAGFAAAYGNQFGFGRQQALEAVTINAARIFGLDARLGSIEVGKDATLFLADGDPFEPRTSVTGVFIGGVRIPLVSRQTELFDEYLQREPGLRVGDR